jgi:FKBP-type peptidyl-prolyl cis-trans isomerase
MKNIFLTILAVFTAAVLLGCNIISGAGASKEKPNFDKNSSYALGLNVGAGLRDGLNADSVSPDFNEFMKGMKDGIFGRNPRFPLEEARSKIEIAFNAITEQKNAENKQKGIDFLAENAKKAKVKMTDSGLQYEVIVEGKGKKPTENDTVKVHYEGRLIDDTLFDNSYERQEPVTFALADVIPGWSEGLQLMTEGSKYKLYIPYEIGYGAFGYGPIPAYSTLIFTVELLEVISKKQAVRDDYDDYYYGW